MSRFDFALATPEDDASTCAIAWQQIGCEATFPSADGGTCYRVEDFGGDRLKGLTPEDFYLAIRGNDLVEVVAAWDMRSRSLPTSSNIALSLLCFTLFITSWLS